MEGHMFSGLALNTKGNGLLPGGVEEVEKLFPALTLLISGKHTELVFVNKIGEYTKLGETLDDAVGEAFDKVGRMLNFGYPGGPVVCEFAKKGTPGNITFTVPMKNSGDMNFSYSGLKTAALYKTKELREAGKQDKEWVYDFCRGFLDTIIESLELKLKMALEKNPDVKTLLVGGGVFNSEEIVRKIGNMARSYGLNYIYSDQEYRGDNAGMIGVSAYFNILDGKYISDIDEIRKVDRDPRLSL
jgi:N6-L-threonylcarbamoyladenine synthase